MGHSLQGLQREEAGTGGCCCCFWCRPWSCSGLRRWQGGVRAGGHISPPQGPTTSRGVQDQPHESLWHPSATPHSLGPSSPFPSLGPQCWFPPAAPCPSCAPVLPALHLSQGLLPSLLPMRNKSPSKSSLGSRRKQLPTLSPLSHGICLSPGSREAFPRAQEVSSGDL